MNKFKNDPDYGDYLHDQKKDRKAEALDEKKAAIRKNFWNDIIMRDSAHSTDICLWYKGQFIGFYPSLRSAQSKSEEMYGALCNAN